MQDVQWCSRCQQHLPLAQFGKWSRGPNGLKTWCRSCRSVAARQKRLETNGASRPLRKPDEMRRGDGRRCCGWCKEWLPATAYSPSEYTADGLALECRECRRLYQERRTRARGVVARRRRDPALLSQGFKECFLCDKILPLSDFRPTIRGHGSVAAYCRSCGGKKCPSHREKGRVRMRLWCRDNEAWRRQHSEYMTRRRQLIVATSDGTVTASVVRSIYETEACAYCHKTVPPDERTMEHRLPLSRGGRHTLANVTMACLCCNCSKQDRTEEEFLNGPVRDA